MVAIRFTSYPRITTLGLGSVFLAGTAVLHPNPAPLAIFLACYGVLLLGLPIAANDFDVFHPVSFLGILYLLEVVGPVIDLATTTMTEHSRLLLGYNMNYLLQPLLIVQLGLASLVIGYFLPTGEKLGGALPTPPSTWNRARCRTAIRVLNLLGFVFLIVFVVATDVPTTLGEFSQKRSGATVYIRYGVYLLLTAALLAFGNHVHQRRPLRSLEMYPVAIIILVAMMFPIYTSNRGRLIWFIISLLVVYHYVRRRLPLYWVTATGVISLTVVSLMGGIRKAGRISGPQNVLSYLSPDTALKVVAGADFGGITALSHVIHQTPEQLPFKYGSTFLKWITFPVPRVFWREKPVQLSRYLARVVYGKSNGTPGTVIAEFYLNYGVIGVVVGMAILGVLLRAVYVYLVRSEKVLPVTLLYIGVTIYVFAVMFPANVSKAIISGVLRCGPLVLSIIYITGARPIAAIRRAQNNNTRASLTTRAVAQSYAWEKFDTLYQSLNREASNQKGAKTVKNSIIVVAIQDSTCVKYLQKFLL
ncbi:O-antigen polymerase [Halorussus halophilus]|uniref:O-antigen polymerase n=1 Tax=Halorussus halophilus TaxID=2650975 RepID=UPI001300CE90|nr:O-antigen polymerase [Halorussus halophilus]